MSVQRTIASFSDIAANDSEMVTSLFTLTVHDDCLELIVDCCCCCCCCCCTFLLFSAFFKRQTELFAERLKSKFKRRNRLYNIAED